LAASAVELGLWSWDIAGDTFWITDKARAFCGFTASERIDLNQFLLKLHPDDRESMTHALAKSMNDEGGYESEHRIVLPGRLVRWIAARGRVEFNGRGKPVLMRGVSLDITARKQAELEVQQQRSELAHLSRVTMLGELSGSLAHELNQPLTAILSNAQAAQRFLAHDKVDLVELRAILADIVAEDKRAGEIIHRLRLLLKKGEVQYQPIDVNNLVLEVLKLMRSDLVNHGVTAQTDFAPDLPVVHGDRVQFQQVLLNLVMNACDAMNSVASGKRQLSVRTKSVAGPCVEVSVSDCGHGIPADMLEKIFEPFFTTKAHGMGLGLSVCRSIITAHDGKLWAENNPGRGATFYFTKPSTKS
jgi:two-component system, LuxR family, sensor kinase FixL